jgi:hypothetical protein
MAKARASLVTTRQLIAIFCQRPRALDTVVGFLSFGLLGASPSARKTVLDAIFAGGVGRWPGGGKGRGAHRAGPWHQSEGPPHRPRGHGGGKNHP